MEETKSKATQLTDHVTEFLDTYYKLTLVNVTDKTSGIASGGFIALVLCVLGGLVLFFAGIGLAIWLGQTMNSRISGYFIVAVFYLLLTGFIFLFRKKIVFPFIRNIIVRKMYE